MADQGPDIIWREDKVPVSSQFDDPYFSLENGLAETRHVFLSGNRLEDRLRDGFHVAELGFGTGLNLLALAHLWQSLERSGLLRFTSFEAFPVDAAVMEKTFAHFPEIAPFGEALLAIWPTGARQFRLGEIEVSVEIGDARDRLRDWNGAVDAWFLDGFSPARNPELWKPDLMNEVCRTTKAGGTFATYTAAGHVRQSLSQAGFFVERIPGYGRKRHMSVGTKAHDGDE